MAKSLIVKNHPIALPAPLDKILSVWLHTEDGGQRFELQLKMADGFEPETLPGLLQDFAEAVEKRDTRIKHRKAEIAERKRIAKEEEQARVEAKMKAEAIERERQTRRADFLAAKATPLTVPFDSSSMWFTTNVEHALQVAINVPQLQCAGYFETESYIPGAGNVSQRAYAFFDPEHVGGKVCPLCGHASVTSSVSQSSGRIHRECSKCKFFSNELPQSNVRGVFV